MAKKPSSLRRRVGYGAEATRAMWWHALGKGAADALASLVTASAETSRHSRRLGSASVICTLRPYA
ncbi:MAG TPA: hypothetical protein VF086_02815 [Propionibacteriaceae bacterium]